MNKTIDGFAVVKYYSEPKKKILARIVYGDHSVNIYFGNDIHKVINAIHCGRKCKLILDVRSIEVKNASTKQFNNVVKFTYGPQKNFINWNEFQKNLLTNS